MDEKNAEQTGEAQDQIDNSKRNIVAALLGSLGVAALSSSCTNQTSPEPSDSVEPIKRVAEAITGTQQLRWVSWIGTNPTNEDLPSNLRDLDGPTHGEIVIAEGFWEPGDGGGGIFYWDETSCTDDGGTIIVPNTNAPVPPNQGSSGACWKRIYSGPLNVRWFGAHPSKTNNAVWIQQAINSLAAEEGGTVLVPRGTYPVSSVLDLPSRTILRFAGGAKLTNTTTDVDFFGHTSDTANADITIDGATLEGNPSGTSQQGARFNGVARAMVVNCALSNVPNGLVFVDCSQLHVCQNTLVDCGSTTGTQGGAAIWVSGASSGTIQDNVLTCPRLDGIRFLHFTGRAGEGFVVRNNTITSAGNAGINGAHSTSANVILDGNVISTCGTLPPSASLLRCGLNFHGLSHSVIVNNIVRGSSQGGISINGEASEGELFPAEHLVVAHNICEDHADGGIVVWNAKHVVVQANHCRNNKHNISVGGSECVDIKILGNHLFDGYQNYSDLLVSQGANGVEIDGNTFGQIDRLSADQVAIRLDQAGRVIIGDNDFHQMVNRACIAMIPYNNASFDTKTKILYVSAEITLSGTTVNEPLPFRLPSIEYGAFVRVYAIYTEATSADSGVVIGLGNAANPTWWADAMTEANKTIGDRLELSLVNYQGQVRPESYFPRFYCAGGKTGTGKLRIVAEYCPNLPIYC